MRKTTPISYIDDELERRAAVIANTRREKAIFYLRNLMSDVEIEKFCLEHEIK